MDPKKARKIREDKQIQFLAGDKGLKTNSQCKDDQYIYIYTT
jgi:hypothetical protein